MCSRSECTDWLEIVCPQLECNVKLTSFSYLAKWQQKFLYSRSHMGSVKNWSEMGLIRVQCYHNELCENNF